jgi:hypothetical protein
MENDRLQASDIRRRASFDSLSVSEDETDATTTSGKEKSKTRRIAHDNLTIKGLAEKGLRVRKLLYSLSVVIKPVSQKTLKKNTWIYVCDTERMSGL